MYPDIDFFVAGQHVAAASGRVTAIEGVPLAPHVPLRLEVAGARQGVTVRALPTPPELPGQRLVGPWLQGPPVDGAVEQVEMALSDMRRLIDGAAVFGSALRGVLATARCGGPSPARRGCRPTVLNVARQRPERDAPCYWQLAVATQNFAAPAEGQSYVSQAGLAWQLSWQGMWGVDACHICCEGVSAAVYTYCGVGIDWHGSCESNAMSLWYVPCVSGIATWEHHDH